MRKNENLFGIREQS